MKKIFAFITAAVLLYSCTSRSGNKVAAAHIHNAPAKQTTIKLGPVVRAKVLESGTMTYCYLNNVERSVFKVRDTVWLDLNTHKVDDTSNFTMKVVLLPR